MLQSPSMTNGSGLVEPLEPRLFLSGTALASRGMGGVPANNYSQFPSLTAKGDLVVFESGATNLVLGDTNGKPDIFIYNRVTKKTFLVSVSSSWGRTDGESSHPVVSGDGRFVAFDSDATNLVPGDTNAKQDIFLRDRKLNITTRVSVGAAGLQANDKSYYVSISGATGRYIAFASDATNLVSGDTNGKRDLFLYDRVAKTTRRVSVRPGGTQANDVSDDPSLSADGRYVAFASEATNLVPGDTNGETDIFLWDRTTGKITRVSLNSAGKQLNKGASDPFLSGDGHTLAFTSSAANLVPGDTNAETDAFVKNLSTGKVERVNVRTNGKQSSGVVSSPITSADGRYVAYYSWAGDLVTGDTNNKADVFLRDRVKNTTTRVSVSTAGAQSDDDSYYISISGTGQWVAFRSSATNLVPGDTNGVVDIFLRLV